MSEPFVPLEFESEYVVGAYGTAYRAIDVFRTGEVQGTHNERLRIIKLLETYIEAYGAPEEKIARNLFTRAIREIKGEQK